MAISVFPAASGGLQQYEQIFTSSGTWNKPAGVKTVEVAVIGGGGASNSNPSAGGGGGVYSGIVDVSSVSSVPVVIGAGATGGFANAGGDSSFGNFVVATGGRPGTGANVSGESGTWYLPTTPGPAVSIKSTFTGMSLGSTTARAVAYNGQAYVHVSGSTVHRSTNLSTWTNVATLSGFSVQYPQAIEHGGGLFVVLSENSSSYATSTDGITWTTRTAPITGVVISYANGKWWLAGGGAFYSSNDAITWTSVSFPYYGEIGKVAYGNGKFVATAINMGSQLVWTSTDGVTWGFATHSNLPYYWIRTSGIVFRNGKFYAWGGSPSGATSYQNIVFSTDGITWFVGANPPNYPNHVAINDYGYALMRDQNGVVYQGPAENSGNAGTFEGSSNAFGGSGWLMSIKIDGTGVSALNTYAGAGYSMPQNPDGQAGGAFMGTPDGNATYGYTQYRFEGFARGGISNRAGIAPGDGGSFNGTTQGGKSGLVRVRWWA